jgi:hypothetical protein
MCGIGFFAMPALAGNFGPAFTVDVPAVTPADFGAVVPAPEAHWFWSVLGGSLVASILAAAGKLVQSLIAGIRDARLAKACQFVYDATMATYQEYVRAIKTAHADGKLTLEEKNEALQYAYRKAVEIARNQGFDLLKTLGKEAVLALIEKYVGQSKAAAVAAPLPVLPDLSPGGS